MQNSLFVFCVLEALEMTERMVHLTRDPFGVRCAALLGLPQEASCYPKRIKPLLALARAGEFSIILNANMWPKGYSAAFRLQWGDSASIPQTLKGTAERCVCWGFGHEQKHYLSNSLGDCSSRCSI